MMGIAQSMLSTPISKGNNCILAIEDRPKKEKNCIRCSSCIDTCPIGLMPITYASLVKNKQYDELDKYYIDNCVECGCCSYVCPSNIPLVQYIKLGKIEAKKRRTKQ